MLSDIKNAIKSIVLYEITSLQNVDLEKTVNTIESYVNQRGLFQVSSWQDSEELHLLVLDWMSMYEAIWEIS